MDVSDQRLPENSTGTEASATEDPNGRGLIDQVVTLTGLPENLVHQELSDILRLSGKDSDELTLEQLREAMLSYLQALDSAQAASAEPLG